MINTKSIKDIIIDGKNVKSITGDLFWKKPTQHTDVDHITLVSDKDILSYFDRDIATLTATAYDVNDEVVSGETIYFDIVDGNGDFVENIGSATTGADGTCSVYFSGKNTGSLNIKCFSSNRIIYSEIYKVQDLNLYDDTSTNNISRYTNYNIETTANMTFDSTNGYLMHGVGNKTTGYELPVQTKHIKAKMYSNSGGLGLISIYDGNTVLCVHSDPWVWKYINHNWNTNNRPQLYSFPAESRNKWFILEVEIVDDTVYCTLEQDGNTYTDSFSLNGQLDYNNARIGLGCGSVNSNTAYVKEIWVY